jgi:hypothetical protein
VVDLCESSQEELNQTAEQDECLVPIRIEIDQDGFRYRDTLTWNLHESLVTPEMFAEIACDDFKLPAMLREAIARQIKDQLHEFAETTATMLPQQDLVSHLMRMSDMQAAELISTWRDNNVQIAKK